MMFNAFVMSLLDHCNSLYSGLASREIDKLQRVENFAAPLISRIKRTDHITPVMENLQWLPVIAHIDVKIVNDLTPYYLSSLLASSASVRLPRLMDIAYAPKIWKSLI